MAACMNLLSFVCVCVCFFAVFLFPTYTHTQARLFGESFLSDIAAVFFPFVFLFCVGLSGRDSYC